ncbi:MAG: HK97 gp10 family phage protein, partial [Catonella sp.]
MPDGYDYSEIEAFGKRLDRAQEIMDELFREAIKEIALDFLVIAKGKTPEKTGLLKDRWRIGEIQKQGDSYTIEVFD